MRFGTFLVLMIFALFFSSAFNDYKKEGKVMDLFIVVLSTTYILMMLIDYLIIRMKG